MASVTPTSSKSKFDVIGEPDVIEPVQLGPNGLIESKSEAAIEVAEASKPIRVADKLSTSIWALAVVTFCERAAYYGLSAPLQNYIQNPAHDHAHPGALGRGQEAATNLNYYFTFWSYLSPVGSAILSDTRWGRKKTLLISMPIYFGGLLILVVSSVPSILEPTEGLGNLIVALFLIGLGSGGVKSCLSPFIADQYNEPTETSKVLKNGKEVIVDKDLTLQSIFHVLYWCTNMGAFVAIATVWLEQEVGFWTSYLLPLCMFVVGMAAFIAFQRRYVGHGAKRSVVLDACRALWEGIRGGFNMDAARPRAQTEKHNVTVSWTDEFVDELKVALVACRIFALWPIWRLCQSQWGSNLKSQAATMETHGIPNDLLLQVNVVTVMIFLPIVEKFLYPFLRKHNINFSIINRMVVGFLFEALAMAYAALLQHLVYSAGPCYDAPLACPASDNGTIPNRIHVAAQVPIYFLEGLAEIFAAPAALQFAYIKAPVNMKSTLQALLNVTGALSALIGIALSPMYKDPRFVITYSLLAGLMFAALCLVLWIFWGRDKPDNEDDH